MKIPTANHRRPVTFNMTPMIDIVFLLIIFFLVSSHLAQQETQLELDLPVAESTLESPETNRPRVTINILPTGEVLLGGEPAVGDELQQRLLVERKKRGDELEVRIRSDRTVQYGLVEPVLLACAKAGLWNVTFAVYRE